MKRSLLVPALSFAAVCLFIVAGCSRKSADDNSAVSKPKPTKPAPDFTVAATDLYKEWEADRQKAGEKYGGKQVAVIGRVINVLAAKTPMLVNLAAGEEFVTGGFNEAEKEKFAALKQGQNVTIQCSGIASSSYIPIFDHCFIVKVE